MLVIYQAFFTLKIGVKMRLENGSFLQTARQRVEGAGNYKVAPASRGLFQASRLKPEEQKPKRQIFLNPVKALTTANTMRRDAAWNPPEAGATSSDQPAN
jgi:hypothetical protein